MFSFLLGFGLRMIPEVLAFPHPIGFDTVYYGGRMVSGVVWQHWSSVFSSTWLLYALMVPMYGVLRVDPFLLLKVAAPLFYGLNVAGIYYFARRELSWDVKKSLFVGGFFAFQLAALRISWDLLRNTLGLGILLFTLPLIGKLESKRNFVGFVLLSLLAVFAHEYAAVTLLVVVLWMVLRSSFKDDLGKYVRLIFASLPAFAVFLARVYLRMFPIRYAVETNVISAGDIVRASSGKLFFLTNYLVVNDGVQYYPSYVDLALHVSVLFAVLYIPYLFLVWKGFFREDRLDAWSGLLLVGAFGCLVVPFCAPFLWSRWMFMLVYPFTFYAVNGLEKVLRCSSGGNGRFSFEGLEGLGNRVKGIVLVTVLLGSFYLATPVLMNSLGGGVASIPPVYGYFSSAPTVPYQDVDSVIQAIEWLNANMNGTSCVILQHAFAPWGILYLNKSHKIIRFSIEGGKALDVAQEHGFSFVYFVWWNEDIGWYSYVELPSNFLVIQDFGRISVFEYYG